MTGSPPYDGSAGRFAVAEPTDEDTDLGWGEPPADERDRLRWLTEQRPPHHDR